MISRRHTLALFAAAGSVPVVSALASCGPNTADSEQSGEVRIYWWGGDLRNTLTREALDLFEEGQHDVTVAAEYSEWTGYWDKLATQTAGGDAPDRSEEHTSELQSRGTRGSLLDLAPVSELDLSAMDEAVLDTGRLRSEERRGGQE